SISVILFNSRFRSYGAQGVLKKHPLCGAFLVFWGFKFLSLNKPEDQLFVSCIQKERNTQVSAALNGIVKIIKVQNFSVFFVKKIIRMKFHNIAGKFASLWCGFAFTGFS
ncbi:hypothetical protein JR888_24640, partial [Escherichia coli]|nr:hypothetical protein [Escherichia coli]